MRDTIAVRLMPAAPNAAPAWGPLNLAYVDERRELFAFAPERLVLQLRHDPALRQLADTTIDGAAHARLRGYRRWLARNALRASRRCLASHGALPR
ncbi:MAG: hypothetical protein IPP98_09735 [Gemmatimonadetes bacterium]|nr:hypothetical protein [Gemmatimonadota bacterium]